MPSRWTLVARFSNKDGTNWMNNAYFWFDRISTYGATLDPLQNEDMISEGFWNISANEIKITRSDDPTHTALLQTTNNCLKGNTFRQHITSFGNFRNTAVWASNKCQGNCEIVFGGQYLSTVGFEMHSCDGSIQNSSQVGFWCDSEDGDGAVMMIGGGGSNCQRADHGIAITEEEAAKFGGSNRPILDFGYDKKTYTIYEEEEIERKYALNLWVQ